jgi:hypothetical protein
MHSDDRPTGSAPETAPAGAASSGPPPDPVGAGGLSLVPTVLFSPTRAFRALREDPRWLGPALLVAGLILLATWIQLPQQLAMSEEMAVAMLEKMNAPDEAYEEALANIPDPDDPGVGATVRQVAYGLFPAILAILVGGTLFHLITKIAGLGSRFRLSLSLFSLVYVVSALGMVVKSLVVRATDTMEVTLGPGVLLPNLEFHSIPAIALDLFDLFAIWALILLALGTRVALRASSGAGWGVAVSYWVVKSAVVFSTRALSAWMAGAL